MIARNEGARDRKKRGSEGASERGRGGGGGEEGLGQTWERVGESGGRWRRARAQARGTRLLKYQESASARKKALKIPGMHWCVCICICTLYTRPFHWITFALLYTQIRHQEWSKRKKERQHTTSASDISRAHTHATHARARARSRAHTHTHTRSRWRRWWLTGTRTGLPALTAGRSRLRQWQGPLAACT